MPSTREPLVTYPDETIGAALRRMATRDVGRLPVVDHANPRKLIGMLRRSDLVRAYDVALTKRAAMRHQAQQVRLGSFSGVSIEEFTIEAGSICAGKHISEIKWPRECVIASLRHGRQVMIPHGDTVLRAGDVLVVVVEGSACEEVRQLCSSEKP